MIKYGLAHSVDIGYCSLECKKEYQKKNPELIKGNIKLKWLDIIKISVKGTIAKNAIKKD